MFDEKSLTPGLSELGYVRLKRLTYKASWSSTDVEHLLFASLFGGGNYFLCDFGIRNLGAEQFALECLKLFSAPASVMSALTLAMTVPIGFLWENGPDGLLGGL
jgi:hypothetical protein